MIIPFILVAAIATAARALLTTGQPNDGLPWRTLAVNVAGALLLGYIVGSGRDDQIVLTIAGLGSLTTFSTVAAEAAGLLENGQKGRAMAYVGLTLVVGLTAAWIGLKIGESQ